MLLNLNFKIKDLEGNEQKSVFFDESTFSKEQPALYQKYLKQVPLQTVAKQLATRLYSMPSDKMQDPVKMKKMIQKLYDDGKIELELKEINKLENIIKEWKLPYAVQGEISAAIDKAKADRI